MYSLKNETSTELQLEGKCENFSVAELKKKNKRIASKATVTKLMKAIWSAIDPSCYGLN